MSRKNQCTILTKSKIKTEKDSRTKISMQQAPRTKSIHNKFHEQKLFHQKKNQWSSFKNRKVKMEYASRTKISAQQASMNKKISMPGVP